MARAGHSPLNGDKRGEILAAATRLFARHGFAGTSVQAVADAVSIRKQSLLYHFPTKDELRRAVLESILDYWKDVVPPALLEATTGESRLDSALHVLVDFFTEDRSRALVIIREVVDRPKEMSTMIENHLKPWLGFITDYIQKGQERGEVQAELDPPSYVVQVVILAINLIASAEVIHTIFDDGSKEKMLQRLLVEYHRFAKSALFVPEASGEQSA